MTSMIKTNVFPPILLMFSSGQGVWQAYKGSNRQRTHKEGGGFVGFLEGYCQCEQSMDMVTGTASPTHWGAECELMSCPGYHENNHVENNHVENNHVENNVDDFAFCSGHGVCNGTVGRCACGAGFTG